MLLKSSLLQTDGAVRFDVGASGCFAASAKTEHLNVIEHSHAALIKKAETITTSPCKRVMDVLFSAMGLLALWPVFLIVALAIKLDSPGPVFFRQKRYGAHRVPFMIFKFRSMSVMETGGAFVQARANDARVTRVGRFLRASSLDELPQLFNVLMGHMSLVGPRPHAIAMDDTYAREIRLYIDRHLVRPGLTGLAQVEGFRGPTHSAEAIKARLLRDRVYIRSWSLLGDLRILFLTPLRLLMHKAF